MDANDTDALVALLTDDLEFVRSPTYPDVAIRGRDELNATIAGRDRAMIIRHVVTNVVARRLGANRTEARSYFQSFPQLADGGRVKVAIPLAAALRSMGECVDEFFPAETGWLIRRRVAWFVYGGL